MIFYNSVPWSSGWMTRYMVSTNKTHRLTTRPPLKKKKRIYLATANSRLLHPRLRLLPFLSMNYRSIPPWHRRSATAITRPCRTRTLNLILLQRRQPQSSSPMPRRKRAWRVHCSRSPLPSRNRPWRCQTPSPSTPKLFPERRMAWIGIRRGCKRLGTEWGCWSAWRKERVGGDEWCSTPGLEVYGSWRSLLYSYCRSSDFEDWAPKI